MSNTISSPIASQSDHEIDLGMLLRQIWGHKWLILAITTFSLLLGIFYASRKAPQYQSEILLQIKPSAQSEGIAGRLSQQFMGGGIPSSEITQIALIKSYFILAPVVTSLGLDIRGVPIQSKFKKLLFPSQAKIKIKEFDVPKHEVNRPFKLAFDKENHFSLYDKNNELVLEGEIGRLVTSPDKDVRLYVESIDASFKTTFLLRKMSTQMMVKVLKSHLNIRDLGETKQNTGVLQVTYKNPNPDATVNILNEIAKTIQKKDIQKNAMEASKTLNFLYQQLPITRRDLQKSEAALNQYRAKSGKIDIKIQSSYLLQQLADIDKKIDELRINKIDMLQRYTVQHPFIKALDTKIQEFKIVRDKLELELKSLPKSDQIALNLAREIKVKNALYLVLLNKIQELQVVKAGIISDVRILSLAKYPNEPIPGKNQLIYLVSFFFGLVLSFIVIYVNKLLFPKINDPRWTEKYCDLPSLAVIPYAREQSLNLLPTKKQGTKQFPLLAYVCPKSLAIESLRSLRTSLQVKLTCSTNNIVSILGVSPGVGKTFVSANLAYLLASAGKRVLAIDTDMRRGTLHKYFDTPPSPGLAEVLKKQIKVSDALLSTMHDNLTLLPRGVYPQDPSELLMNSFFQEIVEELSKQFDMVIIDTPPILLVTDAVLISTHSATNYLVMGAGVHLPAEIEVVMKRLVNAGVTLNGSVFNFHKQVTASQKGYYKYGYKYNYYYEDKEELQR